MESNLVGRIIERRIKENKKIFSKEELEIINNNMEIVKKIYVMGIISGREIYEE